MRLSFCAVCGSTESLEHHHFVPLELGGPDIETNLLTLCSVHHGEIHGMRRSSNHRELTKAGIAKVAWLGLGSPNPRAGGEANKRKWERIRLAKRALLAELGTHTMTDAAAAIMLNERGIPTPSGASEWNADTIRSLWRTRG